MINTENNESFSKKEKLYKNNFIIVLSKTPVNNDIINIPIKDKLKRSNVDINKLKKTNL